VKSATGTIPIVFMTEGDPVESGFVASLARPGGNITGLTVLADELAGKRLELLKEAMPRISRVAVLRHSTSDVSHLRATEAAAPPLRLHLQVLEVRERTDFDSAFRAAKSERAEALVHCLPHSWPLIEKPSWISQPRAGSQRYGNTASM
jgi:putative ABC transport system substrate-binding protein